MYKLPVSLQKMKDSDAVFVIELYVLQLRTGTVRLAACDTDIDFAGEHYLAVPIQRGEITKSVDKSTDNMDLQIADVDDSKIAYLLKGFDFRGCEAVMFQIAYPDSLQDGACKLCFSGYLDSPSIANAVFSCTVKSRMPNIEVPNRSCQLNCNAEFGDPDDCGASKDERTFAALEGSSQGCVYTEDTHAADYWKDGVLTISGESRLIRKSAGGKIYLAYPLLQEIEVGEKVTLERGCDKTYKTCEERFNNLTSFSGFPSIPWESVYR